MSKGRVLIVEDETVTALALKATTTRLGYEVVGSVASGEAAVAAARENHLDVILMDIRLKGAMDGTTAAETIRRQTGVPSIYLTAYSDQETLQRAKIAEPYGYLVKPYNEKELRAAIEIAMHNSAMERERREAADAIEARERLLQEITDNSPAIVYMKDAEGRYTLANRRFEEAFGLLRSTVRGHDDGELLPGTTGEILWAGDQVVLREGKPTQQEETLLSVEGHRTYLATRFPILAWNGIIGGVCGVLNDVTELKRAKQLLQECRERQRAMARGGEGDTALQLSEELDRLRSELEEQVARRTQALRLANEELESFNQMISHDLRVPLRGIQHLAEALSEDAADRLAPSDVQLVRDIQAQCYRLGRLLSDLLTYAHGEARHLTRVNVNLTKLSREIVEELQRDQPRGDLDVVIANGLECRGDELLLRLVLENLIGNAWKFTRKKPGARIEVGGSKQPGGARVIYVKDNGAGFDMSAAHRLFQPFQRIHLPGEFPGTGLGLSSVKRIVELHGGRVWAEGRVGEGATFWFEI